MELKDGTGTGQKVKIDSYNRIHGYMVRIDEDAFISAETEESFNVTSEVRTFNSTNEHPFFYIKNTHQTKKLIFSTIVYSWNGGDTNYNRAMIKRVYRNPPEPTDNYVSDYCQKGGLNFSTFKEPQIECFYWNGTGDGMTIDLSDYKSISTDFLKTYFVYRNLGSVILDYNNAILFSYQPEEVGKASISLKFYFNHI